jgi:hypothetical protein
MLKPIRKNFAPVEETLQTIRVSLPKKVETNKTAPNLKNEGKTKVQQDSRSVGREC